MSYSNRRKSSENRKHAAKLGTKSHAKTVVPVAIRGSNKITKTFALKVLAGYVVKPRIAEVTTAADTDNGEERWQLWSGYDKPLLEAAGPVEVLPGALVGGFLKALGLDATMRDGRLTVTRRQPPKPPDPPPVTT